MSRTISKNRKKIALIHDVVGYGRAGMLNIVPIMYSLKIEPCPIPTAIFSTHMGYEGHVVRYMNGYVRDSINHYRKLNIEFDAVIIGYIGNGYIVDEVISTLDYFKSCGTRIIFDPIFADNGKLYSSMDENYVDKIKNILPYCDIVIPNETEAKFISGEENIDNALIKLNAMGVEIPIITGIKSDKKIIVARMIGDKVKYHHLDMKLENYCGTGDIFTGLFSSYLTLGNDVDKSIKLTHDFIYNCIINTNKLCYEKKHGIIFEDILDELKESL